VLRLLRNRGSPGNAFLLYYWNRWCWSKASGARRRSGGRGALLLSLWLYEEGRAARAGSRFALAVLRSSFRDLIPGWSGAGAGILSSPRRSPPRSSTRPSSGRIDPLDRAHDLRAPRNSTGPCITCSITRASEESIRRILAALFAVASILIAWRAGTAPQAAFLASSRYCSSRPPSPCIGRRGALRSTRRGDDRVSGWSRSRTCRFPRTTRPAHVAPGMDPPGGNGGLIAAWLRDQRCGARATARECPRRGIEEVRAKKGSEAYAPARPRDDAQRSRASAISRSARR